MARVWKMKFKDDNETLRHYGVKGMAWGYTDGVRNGKRTAEDDVESGLLRGASDAAFVKTSPDTWKNTRGDSYTKRKSSDLFGSKRKITSGGKTKIVESEGSLERLVKKGKKWLDGLFN